MALVVTMSVGFTSVHADPASDNAKIQQVQAQRMGLETKVEIMDNQIEAIMSKIDVNKNNITTTQNNIKQSQVDITSAENNIKTEQGLFDERMRAMYMSGSTSYIDVLIGSKNLGDFISRVENLEKIINFDRNVINDYKLKKAAIDLKKVALYKQNDELISLKTDNEKTLADLTKQKSSQNLLVAQLKAQESQYGVKLLADQAAVAASKVEIQNIRNSAPSIKTSTASSVKLVASIATPASSPKTSVPKKATPSPVISRGDTPISSNSVIAFASNYLGVPYVYGGSSPSGFDCSGFTKYVFGHFGINLPRVADAQQNVGAFVSRANLMPGDLVFFGSPAYHVGIYVGNGNMIDAPHTGTVVKIQQLGYGFTGGRRVK